MGVASGLPNYWRLHNFFEHRVDLWLNFGKTWLYGRLAVFLEKIHDNLPTPHLMRGKYLYLLDVNSYVKN